MRTSSQGKHLEEPGVFAVQNRGVNADEQRLRLLLQLNAFLKAPRWFQAPYRGAVEDKAEGKPWLHVTRPNQIPAVFPMP